MSKPTVVVFTANSNTGSAAIDSLLEKHADKVKIRGIVRKLQNGDQFQGRPVEIVLGDIQKPLMHGPVFKDASVAFFATPTTTNRVELGRRFIDACLENGIQYGIFVSVIGADKKMTEYHRQFAAIEEYALSKAGVPVKLTVGDKGKVKFCPIILRCAPFYQNFYGSLLSIQSGKLYYPVGLLGKIWHVDFADVGNVVAAIMVNPEPHANKIYNLVGEYQAGNQIAAAITMKAGVACAYENVDDEIAIAAFEQLGLQPWIAEGNVETLRWLRGGNADGLANGDIQAITGVPAIRFGDFVRDNLKPMLA